MKEDYYRSRNRQEMGKHGEKYKKTSRSLYILLKLTKITWDFDLRFFFSSLPTFFKTRQTLRRLR